MIIEKIKSTRNKELVAFTGRLDDVLPKNLDTIYREIDGKSFYIKHIIVFDDNPICQDKVIIVVGDIDRFLKEGDEIYLVSESHNTRSNTSKENQGRHYIPGGWWEQSSPPFVPKNDHSCCPTCGKRF